MFATIFSRRATAGFRLAILVACASTVLVPIAFGPAQAQTPPTAASLDQGQTDVRALLANYGTFVQHPRFGEVWRPGVTPPGWHPYPPCNWVFTKKFGWYYQDPTPWGQVVHHFGRWSNDPQYGWIWIPGDEFAEFMKAPTIHPREARIALIA